jgi:hypothetical protein
MDAYVINLDTRQDRWKECQRHFKGSSIRLHRVSAVEHPVGAYGNFLSFIKVIRMARTKGLSAILILEDDCLPRPNWERRWKAVKEWLDTHPDTWDIYSGGSWGGNSTFQNIIEPLGFKPKELGRTGDSILFQYPFVSFGAHWLYIPKRSYNKLLDYYPCVAPIASVLPFFGIDVHQNFAFNTISSYPFIAYQDSSYSNLQGKFMPKERILKDHEQRVKRNLTRKKRDTS